MFGCTRAPRGGRDHGVHREPPISHVNHSEACSVDGHTLTEDQVIVRGLHHESEIALTHADGVDRTDGGYDSCKHNRSSTTKSESRPSRRLSVMVQRGASASGTAPLAPKAGVPRPNHIGA